MKLLLLTDEQVLLLQNLILNDVFHDTDLAAVPEVLRTDADQGAVLGQLGSQTDPKFEAYITEARELCDDDLEIDRLPLIAPGEDGCWVSAWVHVPHADAGVE